MLKSENLARVEIQWWVESFLGYIKTSIRVEKKNIPTRAKTKNTICSIFIGHDL